MKKTGSIITLVLLGTMLTGIFGFMIYNNRNLNEQMIIGVEVTGDKLLKPSTYLAFAKLNEMETAEQLQLPAVKKRFEAHPYIQLAELEVQADGRALVHLTEKKPEALLVVNNESWLLTDQFEIIRLEEETRTLDLPIITNSSVKEPVSGSMVSTPDLRHAMRIIKAARLIDAELHSNLSDINLRAGKEIVLSFTDLQPFVLFGKNNVVRKLVYINSIREGNEKLTEQLVGSAYIDVRYDGHIYLGRQEDAGIKNL